MNFYLYLKVRLFCKGRELFDSSKQDFPLHRAVFENNLPMISRLINCTHDSVFYVNKNELDSCGNTPLILAVKLGYIDAVKVLSDLFTCPKLKSLQNCKFIQGIMMMITLWCSSLCNGYSQYNKEQRYTQDIA
jgi:hypothetical protein